MTPRLLAAIDARRRRSWWQITASTLAMILALGGALFVAWKVPVPAKLPQLALNSSWVFRGEVFIGFLVVVYATKMLLFSLGSGEPISKLGFGPLSIEQEVRQVATALASTEAALEAAEPTDPEARERFQNAMRDFHQELAALDDLAQSGSRRPRR
jgi:hypothetical protein